MNAWTIFISPRGSPGQFVVKKFIVPWGTCYRLVEKGSAVAETLEGARALIPRGLFCVARCHLDRRSVVETWM